MRTNTHAWRTGPRRLRVTGVQCRLQKTIGKLHVMHQWMHEGLQNVTLPTFGLETSHLRSYVDDHGKFETRSILKNGTTVPGYHIELHPAKQSGKYALSPHKTQLRTAWIVIYLAITIMTIVIIIILFTMQRLVRSPLRKTMRIMPTPDFSIQLGLEWR